MPIPRNPTAPHFNCSNIREFLQLILIHGANAGVTDIDSLVSFIKSYSSDRVRDLIRYMPEFDPDISQKTWSEAETALLNLYGSFDEKPPLRLEKLLKFCQDRCATSSLHNISDVQQYLRAFISIAAPLFKQSDITESQRDYYFVSGIPSRMKPTFISRVPDNQRTRSNPIPLTDSVAILRELLADDFFFPNLWDEQEDSRFSNASSVPFRRPQS
ncbi:hypothetical protein C8J57DRAFT_1648457 [Mycena rebaudengoi]|nr:hypothetical protein C8J57DRAFT_1648457 [Mycena rebaudengoi]